LRYGLACVPPFSLPPVRTPELYALRCTGGERQGVECGSLALAALLSYALHDSLSESMNKSRGKRKKVKIRTKMEKIADRLSNVLMLQ